jgi:SNF family Na+-dependent transporter
MKHTNTSPTRGVQMFADISAYVLLAWLLTFLLPVIWVSIQSGHFPVYAADPDIYSRSVFLNIIFFVNVMFLFAAFPAAAALIMILIHLFVNKYSFKKREIVLYLTGTLAFLVLFVFRYALTPQFDWFYD